MSRRRRAGLGLRGGLVTCCYCDGRIQAKRATREHFVAVKAGGAPTAENIKKSCCLCNEAAGTLSVEEKLAFRLVLLEEMARAGMHRGQPVTFRVLLRAAHRFGLPWNRNRAPL